MAYEFYVTVKGTKQGQFKGESVRETHKDQLVGLGFTYEVVSARDAATGQASGKRQQKPVVIVKEWGAASPQLHQAAMTNEVLDVEIEFTQTDADGAEAVFERIHLTNATISDLKRMAGDTVGYADGPTTLEEITFTCQKLELETTAQPAPAKPGRVIAPVVQPVSPISR